MTPPTHSGLLSYQKTFRWVLMTFMIAGSYFTSTLRAQNTNYKDINGNQSLHTSDMGYPKGTVMSSFNTGQGFHDMSPIKAKKPVNINVSNQTEDSVLKNEMKRLSPVHEAMASKQDLKVVADSILREGLDLYQLVKLSGTYAGTGKAKYSESMSYLDNDSIRTIFCQPEGKDIRVKEIATCAKNDTGTNRHYLTDRFASANEKRLLDILKEIRGLIQDSPNLNGNSKLIEFDIAELDKNNFYYFYLLPRALDTTRQYVGGDYIFRYSFSKQLISIDPQHGSLLAVESLKGAEKGKNGPSEHTHDQGFSEFMTATDICQAKLSGCPMSKVMGENYTSEFNPVSNVLTISRTKK